MNSPAQGVAAPLKAHVHLISGHPYPRTASLGLEQAFRYLVEAPSIVKRVAPMSWTYVQAPQDGTVLLEWLPMENSDNYPSDGYIWGDQEQTFRQDFNGYTIELKAHTFGFRPGHDQMTQRARTRYHLVMKNPTVNAAPPDPSLWLVHYHPADRSRTMQANSIAFPPLMQQLTAQRRWLESQGGLERREFMLHDRENWPTLNVPNGAQMQPGGYNANAMAAMQNRYPQQHFPSHPGGPPSKRARIQGPGGPTAAGGSDGFHDTSFEEEEDTHLGDFFDHFTQRDISLARYTQHHRWIEEVFSSPYGSHQIVPPDLGLGLMGELKGLTDGILEPPSVDSGENTDNRPRKPKEAEPFSNLKPDQVAEFTKRVEKHLEEGKAEIERMKAEHAEKMQGWKKVKSLTQAEKRLRYATWKGHEGAVPVFRLEENPANGHIGEEVGKENVEDVVKDVEDLLKTKISPHGDATRITRGGLRDRKEPVFDYEADGMTGVEDQQQQAGSATDLNGTLLDPSASFDEAAITETEAAPGVGDGTAPSTSAAQPAFGTTQEAKPTDSLGQEVPGANPPTDTIADTLEDMPEMDMNDMMDMDVDGDNLDFGEANPEESDAVPEPLDPPVNEVDNAAETNSIPAPPSTTNPETAEQNPPPQAQPAATEEGAIGAETNLGDEAIGGETNMFNDDTFDDLTNIDGGGDDALIDFEGGEMGMDDSAFGDALHGMDAPEGGES